MKKTLVTSVILAAGLTVAGFASAGVYNAPKGKTYNQARPYHANPWYVGVGANYYAGSTEKLELSASTLGATAPSKLDSRGVGFNLFAGRDLYRHFGAEGGFTYLGKNEWKSEAVSGEKYKSDSNWFLYFDALAHAKLNQYFCLFAKAGVDYFQGELKRDPSTTVGDKNRLNTFGLNYGAGLQFNYQQFGARLGYTQLLNNKVQKDDFEWAEPSFLSLDFFYRFG